MPERDALPRPRRRPSLPDAAAGIGAELLFIAALAGLGLAIAAVAALLR